MKGKVLLFDSDSNEGEIEADNGLVYEFHIGEWLSCGKIETGCRVGFEVMDDEARHIRREEEVRGFEVLVRVEVSF